MTLCDIFSGACFRSPEAAKAADLKNLCRRLEQLAGDRLDIMLENAFEKAEALHKDPAPVTVGMVFRHLKPEDITEAVLEKNNALDFLHYLARDTEAQLTVAVTPVKSRPFFWQAEKDCATYAKLSITIDPGKPYAESRVLLAKDAQAKTPAPSAPAPV